MCPTDFLYLLLIGLIRTVKWIELQFLKLCSPWITSKWLALGPELLGVVFHLTDHSYKKWSPEDEKKALVKWEGRYDRLVHIRVRDPSFFVDQVNTGNYGTGEGYVNGLMDFCKDEGDLVEYLSRAQNNLLIDLYQNWWTRLWTYLEFGLFNLQTRTRATDVTKVHYDLGNNLMETMLGPHMQYNSGYWAKSTNLDEAQQAKFELIAKKLKLKPGMRVLDIGCGWGTLCKYLAQNHQVECVGVNISTEGVAYARKACKGLPVEIRLQDYRDIKDDSFDRIVAIEIMEHIGSKNYTTFFEIIHRNLKDDGLCLIQTIGENHKNALKYDRWLSTYIFPGASLPSARDITEVTLGNFIIEDWHNFGHDYGKTVGVWRENFKKGWPKLKASYDEKFYRMWIYYTCFFQAGFLSRRMQLWQIVLSKDGLKDGYISVR